MPSTSKDVIAAYNLTPRDVDIAIKALITMVDGNLKPDFEKLAKLAGFKDGVAAGKGWWATRKKLQAAGKAKADTDTNTDTKASDNIASSPIEARGGKRKLPASAPTTPRQSKRGGRGRGRAKNYAEPADDDDDEDEDSGAGSQNWDDV
ncbi:hypothetical protein VP1G_07103 [Cytospora mali]|uniref:Uncharacterized protein n=1 Tax=Cytospora mali TaxID=578113 RepID=A0A194V7K8_CYTMA|nr:hypothetical protein VP1G_07103 [Valsa mali var. pyri (nom. inval.)]